MLIEREEEERISKHRHLIHSGEGERQVQYLILRQKISRVNERLRDMLSLLGCAGVIE